MLQTQIFANKRKGVPFPQCVTVRRVEKLTLYRNFLMQLRVKLHSVREIPKPWTTSFLASKYPLLFSDVTVAIITAIAYTDPKSNYTKAGYLGIKMYLAKKCNMYKIKMSPKRKNRKSPKKSPKRRSVRKSPKCKKCKPCKRFSPMRSSSSPYMYGSPMGSSAMSYPMGSSMPMAMGRSMGSPMGSPMGRPMGSPMSRPMGRPMPLTRPMWSSSPDTGKTITDLTNDLIELPGAIIARPTAPLETALDVTDQIITPVVQPISQAAQAVTGTVFGAIQDITDPIIRDPIIRSPAFFWPPVETVGDPSPPRQRGLNLTSRISPRPPNYPPPFRRL